MLAASLCAALLAPSSALAFPGMDKKASGTEEPPPMAPVVAGAAAPRAPLSEAETKKLVLALDADADAAITVLSPAGKPAAGVAVSLVVFVHDTPATRLRAITDASGVARFTKVPRGEHARHTVTTAYSGVNYSEAVVFEGKKKSAEATLRLADTTTDASKLRIARAHLIVDPSMQGIRVTEVIALRNAGDATYAGAPLQLPLFEGAAQLEADKNTVPSLRLEGGALRFGGYLRPGDTQIQYDYTLPLTGSFQRKTMLPIEKLFVVLTKPRFKLSGASLKEVREMSRKGTSFLLAQGGPIAAGGPISFEIAPPKEMLARGAPPAAAGGDTAPSGGGAAASTGAGGGGGGGGEAAGQSGGGEAAKGPEGMGVRGELVKDWRTVVRWLTPLFAILIFFFALYLAGKRDERSAGGDLAALLAERERLLAELAVAVREAAGGYRGAMRKEAELTRRLADLYRVIDEQHAKQFLDASVAAARSTAASPAAAPPIPAAPPPA